MHTPPGGLEVGTHLSQEEIEEAFDTGFGYRISGINPRRDDNDNRYLLVFANEDGPYDDSVRQGRFEYIGEGLSGDQSEDSPGNSTLIDATSGNFPVYFFYKEQDRAGWEYQGEVDVLNYRHEERGGREVLVFTMEHSSESKPVIHGLYLVPVNEDWIDDFRRTVMTPIDSLVPKHPQAETHEPTKTRVWGTTETDSYKKETAIKNMKENDFVLFYHDGDFIAGGRISGFSEGAILGQTLWDEPSAKHIYHIKDFTTDVPSVNQVWDLLGYEGRQVVQGFTRVDDERVSEVLNEHGSLESALFGEDEVEPSEDEIEQEKSELKQAVESEPLLTEDGEQYVETRRNARDHAFAELVREAYENTCAVCGSKRESPNGNPEVEGAHIYPRSEGGRDDVRNGGALCRLHHWAFDVGWLSFTDEHEIVVADSPDKNGYHELKQLEGQSLHLPENEEVRPRPMYLEKHRELHGFEK